MTSEFTKVLNVILMLLFDCFPPAKVTLLLPLGSLGVMYRCCSASDCSVHVQSFEWNQISSSTKASPMTFTAISNKILQHRALLPGKQEKLRKRLSAPHPDWKMQTEATFSAYVTLYARICFRLINEAHYSPMLKLD